MRLRVCWFHVVLILSAAKHHTAVRYDRHKLFEIQLEDGISLRMKREIHRHILLDRSSRQLNSNLTILVQPHDVPTLETLLKNNSISHEILNVNVQQMIDEESKNIKPLNVSASEFGWRNFYQLETIYAWLDYVTETYSDVITPLNLGLSYESRPLKGVKLSHKSGNTAVFIEAGIHAKEWIAPAAATFLLHQLITSTDAKIQSMARNFDWIIFPVSNPDGYKYTFDHDRLWRKSREPFGLCFGVDLNRNWDSSWNQTEENVEDVQPCGNNYPGPYAFSAPETNHFAEYLRTTAQSQRIQTYLSFHCAAQKILFPYSGKSSKPTNYDDLRKIGEKASEAIRKSNGTDFVAGNAKQILYGAPGTSMDWVYAELNIPIVFSYELRRSKIESNNFQDRFLLPVDQIEPAGWETLASVMALLDEAQALGYYRTNYSYRPFEVIIYAIGLSVLLAAVVLTGLYFTRKLGWFGTRRSDDRIQMIYHA